MKKMKLKEKQGSYILEAAVIYPVIVIVSTMLLLLMLFFFSSVQDAAVLSIQVRRAAGEASKTVFYSGERDMRELMLPEIHENIISESGTEKEREILFQRFTARRQRTGTFFSMFNTEAESRSTAVWTVIDEPDILRKADFLTESADRLGM